VIDLFTAQTDGRPYLLFYTGSYAYDVAERILVDWVKAHAGRRGRRLQDAADLPQDRLRRAPLRADRAASEPFAQRLVHCGRGVICRAKGASGGLPFRQRDFALRRGPDQPSSEFSHVFRPA
jgi:hypothetical protein